LAKQEYVKSVLVGKPNAQIRHKAGEKMKRYGNLYSSIYDIDNIVLAHKNASRGKSWYEEVKMVGKDPYYYADQIHWMLREKTYKTSKYEIFERNDTGKTRTIYKLPYYPDRIVQWAVLQVIEPVFLRNLIYDTYSALPGRGIHFGLRRLQEALKDKQGAKYCLKFDVKKYYPSIPHSNLKTALRRKFKDSDLLWLLDEIIDSIDGEKGIPIGNYTSQYFANFYLSPYDHWMKERKKIKYYFRYMDDVVVLHKSKKFLHWLRYETDWYFQKYLGIEIKNDWQVFPTYVRGIDFLGYRSFGDRTLLRKSTTLKFKRAMQRIQNGKLDDKAQRTIASYNGWLKWCDSLGLRRKYLEPLLEVNL